MPMTIKSAEERQREYERQGLRSWEIAEQEAEYRRQAQMEALTDQAMAHGMPEFVGSQGENMQFTDERGIKRTFTPSGDQTSLTLPSHMAEPDLSPSSRERLELLSKVRHDVATGTLYDYKNQYSPADQRRIERLFEARSQFITDPDLEEVERQSAIDMIDADISRVPRLSPVMQQPSPQQQFESQIVDYGGKKFFYDGKDIKPLVDPKQEQEDVQYRQKLWAEQFRQVESENKDNKKMSFFAKVRLTNKRLALMTGDTPDEMQVAPELNSLWDAQLGYMDYKDFWETINEKGRASRERVMKARETYAKKAIEFGIPETDARLDFMMRWDQAKKDPNHPDAKVLPDMTAEDKAEYAFLKGDFARLSNPLLRNYTADDLVPGTTEKRGSGTVTVDGRTLSTEDLGLKPGESKVTVDGKTVKTFKGLLVMETPEDATKLPSGTLFYDDNHKLRRVP